MNAPMTRKRKLGEGEGLCGGGRTVDQQDRTLDQQPSMVLKADGQQICAPLWRPPWDAL